MARLPDVAKKRGYRDNRYHEHFLLVASHLVSFVAAGYTPAVADIQVVMKQLAAVTIVSAVMA